MESVKKRILPVKYRPYNNNNYNNNNINSNSVADNNIIINDKRECINNNSINQDHQDQNQDDKSSNNDRSKNCMININIRKNNMAIVNNNNNNNNELHIIQSNCTNKNNDKKKKIRRSKMCKRNNRNVSVMYSNIQGVNGKKVSLSEIMDSASIDVCLLAETMTNRVTVEDCKCTTSCKSVGQNVCIITRGKMKSVKSMKLFEPNDVVNMLGVSLEIMNTQYRFYTAHLKQQSTCTRDEIKDQFVEIKEQFRHANLCKVGMLMLFDANVHVGGEGITGCKDKQDWGGKLLLQLIEDENLVLVNNTTKCTGIVTRVDPRDGNTSTIDYCISNKFMEDKIVSMEIDKNERLKPTKYASSAVTKTDHHTIIVKLNIKKEMKEKMETYLNTKNSMDREIFKEMIQKSNIDKLFKANVCNLEEEFSEMMKSWGTALSKAFKRIAPRRNNMAGITSEVREVMKEERWIKEHVTSNPERGKLLFEVRKKIVEKIDESLGKVMKDKAHQLASAKNPQSDVYKVRRRCNKSAKNGFPLKGKDGVLRMSKEGVDKVINDHFKQVFAQNPVPKQNVWEEYWRELSEVFVLIGARKSDDVIQGPTLSEITKIVSGLDNKKSTLGPMSIDLLKLGGSNVYHALHQCLDKCFSLCQIPDQLREEKLVLLYKHAGELHDLDNYRGIFIRLIVLTIYQKWLFMKCSPTVEECGSELAFGGRKGRSVKEALLILKLIQDHSNWSKCPLIIKFLDVQKFFDTMNFKKALVEAYKSGIKGKFWECYKVTNERKICIPYTEMGECIPLDVNEVFVQGSCDAVLMAWNLMDVLNKKDGHIADPVFVIEGETIPRLVFVDDIVEFVRSTQDLQVSNVSSEIFEKENRIKFKISKCKYMMLNCENGDTSDINLNGVQLEKVECHKYLGTFVSCNGRDKDIEERIKESKGVLHEIVELCKCPELSLHRLKFVKMLISACFDSKIKFGCEMWGKVKIKYKKELNGMKMKMLKQVLELPYSTPSLAIQHEFGIVDLDLDMEGEVLNLVANVLKMGDERIAKKLLVKMLEKDVTGFCTHVKSLVSKFGFVDVMELGAFKLEETNYINTRRVTVREYVKCVKD